VDEMTNFVMQQTRRMYCKDERRYLFLMRTTRFWNNLYHVR